MTTERASSLVLVLMVMVVSKSESAVQRHGLGRRRSGESGAAAPERDAERGEVGRNGSGAGGGDYRRLGLLEKPLDGFAVGLVAELSRQLKNPSGAESRHPDPPSSPVDFRVTVFRRPLRYDGSSGSSWSRRRGG